LSAFIENAAARRHQRAITIASIANPLALRAPGIGLPAMSLLESWTAGSHTANGVTHPTYRKGSGPGVIVIHEVRGITPKRWLRVGSRS
jgi:hypothetical protein